MNSFDGCGGGPSISVKMRWTSRSIFSFTLDSELCSDEDPVASWRIFKASSRSLVVMREAMAYEFMALNESGYRL